MRREAYWLYEGARGYQPEIVVWGEQDLIVGDEFRDGNVSAGKDPLSVVQLPFAALPATVEEFAFRGDSACYKHNTLNGLRDPARAGGPYGSHPVCHERGHVTGVVRNHGGAGGQRLAAAGNAWGRAPAHGWRGASCRGPPLRA